MGSKKLAHFSPARTIMFSIFLTICGGTFALSLPIARTTYISLVDLFFTATSATCVTGLFTIPLTSYTFFGKCVILALVQVGGLGLVTLTLFLMAIFVDLGLATQLMAGQLMEIESWRKAKQVIIFIILFTIVIEALGALCMYTVFSANYPADEAWFFAIFSAITSFCNAGIPLIKGGVATYSSSYISVITTAVLMLCGGLGFFTLYEMWLYLKSLGQKKRHSFSLHSKIVLYVTSALVASGAALFWILERANAMGDMGFFQKIANSFFHSVSFKSTGLLAAQPGDLQLASILLMMTIAFIGAAPGSTGSGIKITSFAIFLATVRAALSGKTSVDIFGRRIPKDLIYKAIAIVSLSISWVMFTVFCLLLVQPNWSFIDVVLETISSFTTLGISTGGTQSLSMIGKIFIILSMIVGRIGSMTLILALKFGKKQETTPISYPEERVMLT